MAKKRTGNSQKKAHPTQSFEQLVGAANREALKPYINELFDNMADELSKRVFRQQANIQTRMMAIEKILQDKFSISETDIYSAVADIEDEATGYQTASRPAAPGDLLRITIETKKETDQDWSGFQRRQVTNLMNKGMDPTAMLSLGPPIVEGALVGLSAGESKELTLEKNFKVKMFVDRVSEKIPDTLPEAPNTKQEGTDEVSNA